MSVRAIGGAAARREGRPLEEYLVAMRAMRLDHVRELIGYGVPLRAIAAVCPAPTRVLLDGNDKERYRPDPSGQPAWVFPVGVVDPERPDAIEAGDPIGIVNTGPVVDLVAFHPAAPNRWALRLGNAVVLGAIPPQYLDPDHVPVHRNVTNWLRAECEGIVLLTRDPIEARRILCQIQIIKAEDERREAQLRQLIEVPVSMRPRLTVRKSQKIAA